MNPPANRYATEARAAMQAYNAAMRAEAETQAPPPVAVVPQESDAALIAAALQRWPDMARYAPLMHVGAGMAWDAERKCCVPRGGAIVFEVTA